MIFFNVIDDWKRVVKYSFSFWSGVLGFLVLIVPEIVYYSTGIDTNPTLLWCIGTLLLLFGLLGRLFKQSDKMWVEWLKMAISVILIFLISSFVSNKAYASDRKESALDVAVPLIGKWEGLRLNAYLDIVGVPTICYGSTRGIKLGMRKTKSQCDALLRAEVEEYRLGWLRYVNDKAYAFYLPAERDAAYTSLAYNVGIRGAGRSTATRRLNSGNIRGGCAAIGWWNRAGGRVVRGLVNRRSQETKLCLLG